MEAERARAREAELTKVEIRPLSSRALRRLLRVSTDLKPLKSVVIRAPSSASDLVDDTDLADAEVKDTELSDVEVKDVEVKDAEVKDIVEERPRSTEAKTEAEVRSSTRPSRVGEDEDGRDTARESRGPSAVDAAPSRMSDVRDKDADEQVAELRFELDSEASARDSSSDDAPPR